MMSLIAPRDKLSQTMWVVAVVLLAAAGALVLGVILPRP